MLSVRTMVIIDRNNMMSFQKPYRPTSRSNSLVITIPKLFTDLLKIDTKTKLSVALGKGEDCLIIRKIEDGVDI